MSQKRELNNTLIWNSNKLTTKRLNKFRSLNSGKHYSLLNNSIQGSSILKCSYFNPTEIDTILSFSQLKWEEQFLKIDQYSFSKNEQKILLATDQQSIYRRSKKAHYYVYDLMTSSLTKLTNSIEKQQLASFSPDGSKIAFVINNNIFLKELTDGVEQQITFDGAINTIINGATDWVTEEEFQISKGYEWSPTGNQLSYYKFDETNVKEFHLSYYKDLYPTIYTFKYPKAGEKNAKVSIWLYDIQTQNTLKVNTGNSDFYLPRMKWNPVNNTLFVLRLNRLQNHLEYLQFDPNKSDGKSILPQLFYEEKSTTYLEIDNNFGFLTDGSFIRVSDKDGFQHIYHISLNGKEKQLTKGNWDVSSYLGTGSNSKYLYYSSAERGAMYQDVYRFSFKKGQVERLSNEKGHNSARFTKGMTHYVLQHSTYLQPPKYTLHKNDGKFIRTLLDNSLLRKEMQKYALGNFSFLKIKGAKDTLNAFQLLPPDFDSTKKYPVYVYQYSGPGKNEVVDKWRSTQFFWHQLLAQNGYIVFCVDTRGTKYRGASFKKSTYLQLGKLELEDLIAISKELKLLKHIDSDRIGIQGWSYGGYMSALCMTKGAGNFQVGISVAPVTNWRFYDTIYTERFMRTPQENPTGYDDNSPINYVKKLKGDFLLIHGDYDDNVHSQNTMEMINSLIINNINFESMIYPNRNHGIGGDNARRHLFDKILKFVLQNL